VFQILKGRFESKFFVFLNWENACREDIFVRPSNPRSEAIEAIGFGWIENTLRLGSEKRHGDGKTAR